MGGRRLYAGCAADTLFLPELISRAAQVRSKDPITGQTVSLSLQPDGSVGDLQPATTVLLMAVPGIKIEAVAIPRRLRADQLLRHPGVGTFLLTIEQGVELARRINHTAYASAIRQ